VITFTAEELKGVPKDVVSGYTKRTTEDGKEVSDATYKTPDIFPIVCRRWMFFSFSQFAFSISIHYPPV
jgi:hypothetical protein